MYNDTNLVSVADILSFLNNPVVVDITLTGTLGERANWIFERFRRFRYLHLTKKEKGIVLRYIARVTNLSEKQLDRHVKAYKQ